MNEQENRSCLSWKAARCVKSNASFRLMQTEVKIQAPILASCISLKNFSFISVLSVSNDKEQKDRQQRAETGKSTPFFPFHVLFPVSVSAGVLYYRLGCMGNYISQNPFPTFPS